MDWWTGWLFFLFIGGVGGVGGCAPILSLNRAPRAWPGRKGEWVGWGLSGRWAKGWLIFSNVNNVCTLFDGGNYR